MVLKPNAVVDIAKPGPQLQNLTGMWNARVLDGFTPFVVQFKENGLPVNLTGLNAFIEGDIGEGHYDSATDDIVMTGTPKSVRYTDDGSGNTNMGIVVFRLPPQFFIQTGIFKGFIGLQSSSGIRSTSNDVWFKVLGSSYTMGISCQYFISDFQKALDQANGKIDQALADLYDKYNQKAGQAESNFNNVLSTIKTIQATQQNLNGRLDGIKDQINNNDIVRKVEFNQLSNQLTQQVSQMKEAGLEFFNNADDLKAKYPQGANKLCVTLNDSHEWIYDYTNGQWNDAGAFNYGTIDSKLTTAIYHNNSDNLIPNSDFLTTDLWALGRDQSDPDCFIEPTSRGNTLVVNGYVKDGSTNESWAQTPFIDVADSKYISVGVEIALSGIDYSNGKSAMIGFAFKNKTGNINYYNRFIPASVQDGKYHKITEMHITYPEDTVSVAIAFTLYGYGTLKIRRPQASFSNALRPYSSSDLKTKLALTDDNLLISQPVKDWDFTYFSQKYIVDNDNVVNLDCSSATDNELNFIASDHIAVNSNDQLIANVEAQINSTNSRAYFEITQYIDENTQDPDGNIDEYFINTNQLTDYAFDNIKLKPSTKFIQVRIVTNGKAILKIGKISLKKKSPLDIARDKSLRSKNLAYDFNYRNWRALSNSNFISAEDDNEITKITSIDPIYGALGSEKIMIDSSKPLSISFNSKNDNGNAHIEIQQINEDGTSTSNMNINFDIAKTSILHKYSFSNVWLDSTTKYIKIAIVINNQGSVWISNLQCSSHSKNTVSDSLFDCIPLNEWKNNTKYSNFDEKTNTWTISTRNLQNNYTTALSNLVAVKPGSTIKTEVEAKVGILPNNQGRIYIEIQQFPKRWSPLNNDSNLDNFLTQSTNNEFNTFKFVNKLNDDTHYIRISMVVYNNADFQLRSIKGSYVDEIPNDLPKLNIDAATNITDKWQSAPFKFSDDGRLVEGYVQYAMQGDSSRNYPKKNLKLKFFADADCKQKLKWKPKSDWDSNHKFNVKANWIDATQSRNLVNSKLVKQAISVTPISDPNVANRLLKTQNLGEMEGFPIELSFSDGYYGLMTFNIKKDDKPYGIDSDDPKQEAITNESPAENLDNPKELIDGSHFATLVNDKPSAELQTNFTKFLTFINTASDDDFKKNINNYIDLYSVINLYLFGVWSYEWDYYNKSEILLTYNAGKSYYMLPYDLDSTWRLFWNGSKLNENDDVTDFATANKAWIEGNGNKLIGRIYQLFKTEIKAQWQKLRTSVWTNANAVNEFKKFINSIPESAYEKEQAKWEDIPSKKITNFGQIQQAIIERGNAMDIFINNL